MDDGKSLVDASLKIMSSIRQKKDAPIWVVLSGYLEIIPEQLILGMIQHKVRQHLREHPECIPLKQTEIQILSAQICQQVLNELVQKTRRRSDAQVNEQFDGAELFYRRALNHISMERYADAERLLRRAVQICPEFCDGWIAFIEVLEHNGKTTLAEQARLRLRELNLSI